MKCLHSSFVHNLSCQAFCSFPCSPLLHRLPEAAILIGHRESNPFPYVYVLNRLCKGRRPVMLRYGITFFAIPSSYHRHLHLPFWISAVAFAGVAGVLPVSPGGAGVGGQDPRLRLSCLWFCASLLFLGLNSWLHLAAASSVGYSSFCTVVVVCRYLLLLPSVGVDPGSSDSSRVFSSVVRSTVCATYVCVKLHACKIKYTM